MKRKAEEESLKRKSISYMDRNVFYFMRRQEQLLRTVQVPLDTAVISAQEHCSNCGHKG